MKHRYIHSSRNLYQALSREMFLLSFLTDFAAYLNLQIRSLTPKPPYEYVAAEVTELYS